METNERILKLKARAYDLLVITQNIQMELSEVNKEIAELQRPNNDPMIPGNMIPGKAGGNTPAEPEKVN